MNRPGNSADTALIVDDSACAVYAREIRNLLGVDMFAVIVDSQGNELWTNDEIRLGQFTPPRRTGTRPSYRSSSRPP